jgi:hypothetical protein
LQSISEQLYDFLKHDCKYLKSSLQNTTKHLELLLALLRTRASDDVILKQFFMPQKKISNEFVGILDDLLKILKEQKLSLKSRLNLDIKKPEELYNTPDLIYALRLYLTGDSAAYQISIKNVDDEE